MAPNWLPMCKAMQAHCEPFYAAVNAWTKYEDRAILKNRIQMLMCANNLFKAYGSNKVDDTYQYDIVASNPDYDLLPEVIPVAGKVYVENGDALSYAKVKQETPPALFIKVGIYFQTYVLKALSGWNSEILVSSNPDTRESIIQCMERLYRIPESAGLLHFTGRREKSFSGVIDSAPSKIPLPEVVDDHLKLFCFLAEQMAAAEQDNNSSTSNNSNRTSKMKFSRDGRAWITKNHEVLGEQIARYFQVEDPNDPEAMALFTGVVTQYLPETVPGSGDMMYHVKFDEDFALDINEKEYQEGQKVLDAANVWVDRHPSVGWKVAAKFPVVENGKRVSKVFKGEVVKFSAPTRPGLQDQLYAILFEDGDREDWEQEELDNGRRMYKKYYGSQSSTNSSTDNLMSPPPPGSPVRSPVKKVSKTVNPAAGSVSPTPSTSTITTTTAAAAADIAAPLEAQSPVPPPAPVMSSASPLVQPKPRSETLILEEQVLQRSGDFLDEDLEMAAAVNNGSVVHDETNTVASPSVTSRKSSKAPVAAVAIAEEPAIEEEEVAPEEWTEFHASVGTKVSAIFTIKKRKKVFDGRVVKYCPPSAVGENDQLYRIEFSDGDSADWDQQEFDFGVALYAEKHPEGGSAGGEADTQQKDEKKKNSKKKSTKTDEPTVEPSAESGSSGVEVSHTEAADTIDAEEADDGKRKHEAVDAPAPAAASVVGSVSSGGEGVSASPAKRQRVATNFFAYGQKSPTSAVPAAGPNAGSTAAAAEVVAVATSEDTAAAVVEAAVASPGEKKTKKASKKKEENKIDEVWFTEHSSVGTAVSAYFPCSAAHEKAEKHGRKYFRPYDGTVTMFGPATAQGLQDQLYRIVWEDGDTEDYEQDQLDAGVDLYKKIHKSSTASSSNAANVTPEAAAAANADDAAEPEADAVNEVDRSEAVDLSAALIDEEDEDDTGSIVILAASPQPSHDVFESRAADDVPVEQQLVVDEDAMDVDDSMESVVGIDNSNEDSEWNPRTDLVAVVATSDSSFPEHEVRV